MADYVSVLTGGTNNFATTSEHLNSLATDILTDGVVGAVYNTAGVAPMTGGLAVNAQGTPNMTVAVTAGKAYVTTTPSGQASQRLRANIAAQNVTIAANSTGGTRYDWVYVKIDAANAANPNAAGDNVASLVTSRSTSASTDNGTPPTYGYAIAVVTVSNGATSIVNGNIADKRVATTVPSNTGSDGWTLLSSAPNTVTYNGNRNYDLVYNSTDLTGSISPGMKMKFTRTVAAPTQCADLEASSSQYFSRATGSVTGMTFTDDFTVMAWVKMESYSQQIIFGRMDTTNSNGWQLYMTNTGIVYLSGVSGGTGRQVNSYRSLPLNRWVHITATLDMSGNTGTMYFDGVSIQTQMSGAATSLTNTGALGIGANAIGGATANYADGKYAQVAVFSAILNQSTIQSYISQGLSGSETSLISAFSLNGNANDLNTTNANNLTASGGALATNADSPYANGVSTGTLEYAEVNSITYSTNTTINVRVPDTCMIPTSGGISNNYYSISQNPLNIPHISKIISSSQITYGFSTTSNTDAQVDGLRVTAYLPKNAKLKITFFARNLYNATTSGLSVASVYEGTVGSGTKLVEIWGGGQAFGAGYPITAGTGIFEYNSTTAGNVTFNVGLRRGAGVGTAQMDGAQNAPCILVVELV